MSKKRWHLIWLKLRLRQTLSTFASQISGAGFLAAIASLNVWLAIASSVVRLFSGKPSLETQKARACELISSIGNDREGFRVVYIIDDIDRLEPDEALEVIRLVKAVANFPYVTYVLCYDRPVLSHAIETASGVSDGDAYLEKVIQFGFRVPESGPFRIRRYFKMKLRHAFAEQADWGSMRANVVLDIWAGRLLTTPRDVVRVFEAVRLKWARLGPVSADLLDLIWIEMLKEKASKGQGNLFGWIMSYLGSLEAIAIGGQVSQRRQSQDDLENILEHLGWKRPKEGETTELDFHHLDELLAGVTKGYLPEKRASALDDESLWIFRNSDRSFERFRSEKRLSSPWHWGLYSGFQQSDNALSDAAWDQLRQLAHDNDDQLSLMIRTIMDVSAQHIDRDTIGDQLLDLIIEDVARSDAAVAICWWMAVMETGDAIYRRSGSYGFGFKRYAGEQLKRLTRVLLSQLDSTTRTKVLKEGYENSSSLWALSEVYRDQYFAHSSDQTDHHDAYMTLSEFKVIQDVLVPRLLSVEAVELNSTPDAWIIPYAILNGAGEEVVRVWFGRLTETEENFLMALESLETIQSSEQEVAGIPSRYLDNFANSADVKMRLKSITQKNNEAASKRAAGILARWWKG